MKKVFNNSKRVLCILFLLVAVTVVTACKKDSTDVFEEEMVENTVNAFLEKNKQQLKDSYINAFLGVSDESEGTWKSENMFKIGEILYAAPKIMTKLLDDDLFNFEIKEWDKQKNSVKVHVKSVNFDEICEEKLCSKNSGENYKIEGEHCLNAEKKIYNFFDTNQVTYSLFIDKTLDSILNLYQPDSSETLNQPLREISNDEDCFVYLFLMNYIYCNTYSGVSTEEERNSFINNYICVYNNPLEITVKKQDGRWICVTNIEQLKTQMSGVFSN